MMVGASEPRDAWSTTGDTTDDGEGSELGNELLHVTLDTGYSEFGSELLLVTR